jgi:hypothetical protein
MRHAIITRFVDRAPNMDDWDYAGAAYIQQISRGSHNAAGMRL